MESPGITNALNNLDKNFSHPLSPSNPPHKPDPQQDTERKPEEPSQLSNNNQQNNQNQAIIDEENGLLMNPDPLSYKNEPHREKFMGFYVKRRLPASLLPDRKVYAGIADPMAPDNSVSTSKYNMATFLPLNLFLQFSKVANLYFLMIAVLQVIPDISNTNNQPLQLVPLSFVILVSMIKDAFEDYKRHKSDFEENHKSTLVFRNGEFINVLWQELLIGDIVKVIYY